MAQAQFSRRAYRRTGADAAWTGEKTARRGWIARLAITDRALWATLPPRLPRQTRRRRHRPLLPLVAQTPSV